MRERGYHPRIFVLPASGLPDPLLRKQTVEGAAAE